MSRDPRSEKDPVDRILDQWRVVRPDLDLRAMGIVGRLGRFAKLGERRLEDGLGEDGLTLADFDVLAALRRAGPPFRLSPTQLYKTLMITSGTMTNRLDRLAERGLVSRVDAEADRRSLLVELTAEGRKLVDHAVDRHVAREEELLAPLTRAEQRTLDALARKLLARLEGHVL